MMTLYYPDWETLEIRELPAPRVAEGDVLVRVAACGICGSELETFKNRSIRRTPPLVMGHEFCGTVAEAGNFSGPFKAGQPVISNSIITCGQCAPCKRGNAHLCERRNVFGMHRPGAFAEYISVPASCLIPWPENVPAEAACLSEPLANGIHVAHTLNPYKPRTILVIGTGPIGLMCQQAAQVLLEVKVIVSDISTDRLEVAKKLGALRAVNPAREELDHIIAETTGGEGVDAVVDAVGSSNTKRQAFSLVRPGGSIVWIGLHENTVPVDSYAVTLSEKTVHGSYAATLDELQQAAALMASGAVDVKSWVQTFPLRDGVNAFRRMLAAQGNDIKAVLIP